MLTKKEGFNGSDKKLPRISQPTCDTARSPRIRLMKASLSSVSVIKCHAGSQKSLRVINWSSGTRSRTRWWRWMRRSAFNGHVCCALVSIGLYNIPMMSSILILLTTGTISQNYVPRDCNSAVGGWGGILEKGTLKQKKNKWNWMASDLCCDKMTL